MKKFIPIVCLILGLQSCIIKEEITINNTNKIDYKTKLDGSSAKSYLPPDFFEQQMSFISKEDFSKLSHGMTIQQLLEFLKKNDNSEDVNELDIYCKKNEKIYEQIKNDSVFIDFKELSFIAKTKQDSNQFNVQTKQFNDFVNGLTKLGGNGLHLNLITNKKTVTNKSIRIDFDKNSFVDFISPLNELFMKNQEPSNQILLLNFLRYQVTFNTPKPIKSTNITGNKFSFDRKSVTGDFSINEILDDKISNVEVVYE